MTVADMIAIRAARAVSDTTPHSINGDIFVGDVNKLLTNIKAQLLGFAKDIGALEEKA